MSGTGVGRTVVVDYGMGNLFSIRRAIERVGGECVFAAEPAAVLEADRVILPGVGAFGDAMAYLDTTGLADAIREVAARGVPILGICLGMQLLFSHSDEFGSHEGLGLIAGDVVRFRAPEPGAERFKIPHVGWSTVLARGVEQDDPDGCRLADEAWRETPLAGWNHGAWAYFVHSFYARPADPAHVLSETVYGGQRFCSAVRCDRVFGCQFHPEMSAEKGLAVYRELLMMSI